MQDFTKPATTMEMKPLSQVSSDKVHEKWLNKDRIWNLVFWFGMSAGLALSSFLKVELKMLQISPWIAIGTLVCIPLLLMIFNKTRFIKKDTFSNSENKELTIKQMPYSFPIAIITGVGITFIVSETILPRQCASNLFSAFIFFICVFSGISLYFILKNCPIAILFNYKFWTFDAYLGREGAGSFASSNNNAYYERMRDSSNYMNKISNPAYSYRPDNIWHNR